MVRLLGIGDNTVDIYLTDGMQYPGGNAVNVAVHAGRCGAAAGYLGCLGGDMLGDLVFRSLAKEGVDLSHVRRRDGPNPWSRIVHEGTDRRFAGSNPGVRGHYDLTPDDDIYLAAHDVVHTSVHSGLDAEMSRLRAHASLLSYDYSEHWERPGVAATMRHVDIAFLSAPHRTIDECAALMRWCAAQGPRLVVATRGADGACALMGDEFRIQGVHPAEVVDTLGAGDGMIAGFLVAHASGEPLATCLSRGAAHGAKVCGIKGGFGHGIAIVPGQPGLDPNPIVRPYSAQATANR